MKNILVSVIVPVYNMEKQLEQSVRTIQKQTYTNMEIILVNDGSTDQTAQICRKLQERDSRIVIREQENGGPGLARNTGLKAASGEYIYFMDADDFLEPNAIWRLVTEMSAGEGYDLLVFGYRIRYPEKPAKIYSYPPKEFSGETIRKNYELSIGMGMPFAIQGMFCNKFFSMALIRQYHIRFPNLRRGEDEVFIMRYVDKIRNVKFLPDILYEYCVDMYQFWKKHEAEYYKTVLKVQNYYMDIVYSWNTDNQKVLDQININIEYLLIRSIKALIVSKKHNFMWNYKKIREICGIYRKIMLNPPENPAAKYREYKWLREGKPFLLYLKVWKNVRATQIKAIIGKKANGL